MKNTIIIPLQFYLIWPSTCLKKSFFLTFSSFPFAPQYTLHNASRVISGSINLIWFFMANWLLKPNMCSSQTISSISWRSHVWPKYFIMEHLLVLCAIKQQIKKATCKLATCQQLEKRTPSSRHSLHSALTPLYYVTELFVAIVHV